MTTDTTTIRLSCQHCGLPVLSKAPADGRPVYCCYGCYLVSQVVGRQAGDGQHAWNLLRMGIGAFLAMNVMMISLLLYTNAAEPAIVPIFRWVLLGLSTPAMLILGSPFVLGCLADVRRGRLSLDTLIAVGSITAFVVSAASTIRSQGHIYYDTATMILTLITFGKLIEATAKGRAGQLVRSLETMLPSTATKIQDGRACDVPLESLHVGDTVQVRPGERFPVDGNIAEGTTVVEEAAFTGESQPRTCSQGDKVIAGSVNGAGAVLVEARQVGEQMLLHRMIRMVEDARQHPAPSQRLAEQIAAVFVPTVLVLSAATCISWLLLGDASKAGLAALAVLVVACPCAMGIATPLATAIAIARAARAGIIVRGGDVMERLGQIRVLFFDKTGTITSGTLSVSGIEAVDNSLSQDELLDWLAGLESGSEHAIARAVRAAAAERQLTSNSARNIEVSPGCGIRGEVTRGSQTRMVLAGTRQYLQSQGADGISLGSTSSSDERTAVLVAWDGRFQGSVFFADSIRQGAGEAVARLGCLGIEVRLLSGDRIGPVQHVARDAGIEKYFASCLPDEKLAHIAAARSERPGTPVGMAGDGINDAPALASADLGIAVGAATELTRQSGNVVLLGDQLLDIPWLIALSRRARRVVKQNLLWALGYNAVTISAAVLGVLHPLLAALAMVISSITVISNSSRLARCPDHSSAASRGTDSRNTSIKLIQLRS